MRETTFKKTGLQLWIFYAYYNNNNPCSKTLACDIKRIQFSYQILFVSLKYCFVYGACVDILSVFSYLKGRTSVTYRDVGAV